MAERPLDPQVESYRRELDAAGERPLHLLSVAEAREAELSELGPVSREPVARVVDRLLPGPDGEVPVRIYLPEAVRPLPVLVYFFGGGWVLGSAGGRRSRLPTPRERNPVRSRLGRLPARSGESVPRRARGLLLRDALGRGARLGARLGSRSSGRRRSERRREPRGRGRAARPRTGRACRWCSSCSSTRRSTTERTRVRCRSRSIPSSSDETTSPGAGPTTSPSPTTVTTRSPHPSARAISPGSPPRS